MAYMQSIGKITWTASGPVDQNAKRLSGFVRPLRPMLSTTTATTSLSADTVRSRKRRRIPSQELEDTADLLSTKQPRLNRLSFSALVPFQKLLADATSGDIIDKATVLSYLLHGIVDEGIVFRALWQREALERVLFPLTYHQQTQLQSSRSASPIPATIREGDDQERSKALNEYFDVDQSEAQEKRRILLLGTPKFRFRSSVYLDPPSLENGWSCEEKYASNEVISDELANVFDDDDDDESDHSVWSASEDEEQTSSQIVQKIFYSEAETILGVSYRVQIEAQVMPRHRLFIQDDDLEKLQEELLYSDHHEDELVMVCRFELQRDMQQISTALVEIKKEKDQQDTIMSQKKQQPIIPVNPPNSQNYRINTQLRDKTRIHYWIYCLNRHEGILENEQIDPEQSLSSSDRTKRWIHQSIGLESHSVDGINAYSGYHCNGDFPHRCYRRAEPALNLTEVKPSGSQMIAPFYHFDQEIYHGHFADHPILLEQDLMAQNSNTQLSGGDTNMWWGYIRSDYLVKLDDFSLIKPMRDLIGTLISMGPNKDRKELLKAFRLAMQKVLNYLKQHVREDQRVWVRGSPYGHAQCSQYTSPILEPVKPTGQPGEYEWDMLEKFDLVWKDLIEREK
ncbi:hypothetical protein EDC96DRAFT_581213 [Choanephora cucurbitarum]|nr:hypothetical protein EDC96DRAFT_581213 [Choanephora cucurbitarum]